MQIFSPIQHLQLNCSPNLYVKRDDLIDPFISGNKWRKLKYLIAEAQNQNKTHLVTFGGAYSNHLLATAATCARFNLKSSAFVRGEEVSNEMLMLSKLYGMQLIFVDRESYRDKQNLFNSHFADDKDCLFIDEGGASYEATLGCAEIIDELDQHFDHIFCAAGTGTTVAGLLKGLNKHGLNTKLHIISALKGGDFLEQEIAKYENDLSKLVLHTNYHFGGYAKTTPELISFIKSFVAETGILIDPVYTAKMFYAIKDLTAQGIIKTDAKVLAIHTGGLFGILGMKEKFL
ncbi:MAG: 1-aminocyclopropane-1-carboxylate deaminase/D-cysteine desulfhydrase [Pedobacter sp.]|nr:MAG: 1-aminocyclopropane-1-carboxylate deaminase/D-cysteine desulfhydrase [Pedobacter sp.]